MFYDAVCGSESVHEWELTIDDDTDEPVILRHDSRPSARSDSVGTLMRLEVPAVESTTMRAVLRYFRGLEVMLHDLWALSFVSSRRHAPMVRCLTISRSFTLSIIGAGGERVTMSSSGSSVQPPALRLLEDDRTSYNTALACHVASKLK
jgi:hypothetical protein